MAGQKVGMLACLKEPWTVPGCHEYKSRRQFDWSIRCHCRARGHSPHSDLDQTMLGRYQQSKGHSVCQENGQGCQADMACIPLPRVLPKCVPRDNRFAHSNGLGCNIQLRQPRRIDYHCLESSCLDSSTQQCSFLLL
jgi:hypothetical protein